MEILWDEIQTMVSTFMTPDLFIGTLKIAVPIIIGIILLYWKLNQYIKNKWLQYSEELIKSISGNVLEKYDLRERDFNRLSGYKKTKIHVESNDRQDSNLFLIKYAVNNYRKIVGIDCEWFKRKFLTFLDDLNLIFKRNKISWDIINILGERLNLFPKDDVRFNIKTKSNLIHEIEYICNYCNEKRILVILLNVDMIDKRHCTDEFLYFLKRLDCVMLSSCEGKLNDKIPKDFKFRLSEMDYLSFCEFFKYKLYKANQEDMYVQYLTKSINIQPFSTPSLSERLSQSESEIFTDSYDVIKDNFHYFDLLPEYFDVYHGYSKIPITERKEICDKIEKNCDSLLSSLDESCAAIISLLFHLDLSVYDEDLDLPDVDYFTLRDKLLSSGIIKEMHHQNYCNFFWEWLLVRAKDTSIYNQYFINEEREYEKILLLNKLKYPLKPLFNYSRLQRSNTKNKMGIYLSPLIRQFLMNSNDKYQKYFSKYNKLCNELSKQFIAAFDKNSNLQQGTRKFIAYDYYKMKLLNYEGLVYRVNGNFDTIYNVVGTKLNKDVEYDYKSYLYNKSFKIHTNYYSMMLNELTTIFDNCYLFEEYNTKNNLLKFEVS